MDAKTQYSGQHRSIGTIAKTAKAGDNARDAFLLDELAGRISGRATASVLELSVGDGSLSSALARRFPSAGLTLVDISKAHLETAGAQVARFAKVAPTLIEADLDREFERVPSTSFDAVIALDILEHVFDVFAFVAHCRRVLKPDGTLYLRVPNIAYAKHRIALAFGQLPVTSSWFGPPAQLGAWRDTYGWDGGHLHYFTHALLKKTLAEAGLVVRRTTDAGARFARLRELAPGLLCGNLFVVATRGA